MIILVLLTAVSYSIAVNVPPTHSSYSSFLPVNENNRPHPTITKDPIQSPFSSTSISSKPQNGDIAKHKKLPLSKSVFPPLPKHFIPSVSSFDKFYISPKPSYPSENTYSSKPYSFKKPRHLSTKPSHSLQKQSYSSPKPSYSRQKKRYSIPKHSYQSNSPTYSSPKASHSFAESYYSSLSHITQIGQSAVPIIKDDREHNQDGSYRFSLETIDGIKRQESSVPVYTKDGPVNSVSGSYSYMLPNGQLFELSYIADENGFQPQISSVPLVPDFPHPIPAHALEQLERGRKAHEARALKDKLKKNYEQKHLKPYTVSPKRRRNSGVYPLPF